MNMDSDKLSGLVFIDFHKAFDVINHDILQQKLSTYGMPVAMLIWLWGILTT